MSEKDLVTQEKSGTITFANEVLEIIVGVAACDIPGVAGMSGGLKDGIVEMLGKKNLGKGIKLSFQDDVISIDCYVVALFGYSVIEIAKNVQEKVTSAVESMTGRTVRSVNVEICGITLPKDSKK